MPSMESRVFVALMDGVTLDAVLAVNPLIAVLSIVLPSSGNEPDKIVEALLESVTPVPADFDRTDLYLPAPLPLGGARIGLKLRRDEPTDPIAIEVKFSTAAAPGQPPSFTKRGEDVPGAAGDPIDASALVRWGLDQIERSGDDGRALAAAVRPYYGRPIDAVARVVEFENRPLANLTVPGVYVRKRRAKAKVKLHIAAPTSKDGKTAKTKVTVEATVVDLTLVDPAVAASGAAAITTTKSFLSLCCECKDGDAEGAAVVNRFERGWALLNEAAMSQEEPSKLPIIFKRGQGAVTVCGYPEITALQLDQ